MEVTLFEKIDLEAIAKIFVDALRNYKEGHETRVFVNKKSGKISTETHHETGDDYGRRGPDFFNDHLIDNHETSILYCLAVVGKGTYECFKDCDLTELQQNIISTFEYKILE